MLGYNIEVAKKGVAKITVETDDYKIYRDVVDALTKETDKRTGYTTARPVSEEEQNLLSQLFEEQSRLCECQTELAKAKGYLSELLKAMPYVRSCNSCEYLDKPEYCQRSRAKSDRKCHMHKLQTEIEAFLKGEKKDECGNV